MQKEEEDDGLTLKRKGPISVSWVEPFLKHCR